MNYAVAPSEGQKSGKWLKKPGLPLVIISRDSTHPSESHGSLNKSKRPKRSVKTNQPKLPIFQLRDRLGRSKPRESASEISQTDKSSDDETSRRLNLSDDHDSGEDLCQAEIATRHCGERKRNPHRWSRASKKRKVKKQTGSKESIKKSYKDRFRTFFARKSRQSFKKIRKILNRVTLSGRSSKKDIGNCVSGRSSTFTHLNYPVMVSSKVTCTSESNDSFFEIEPRASPTEEIIPPVVKTCATSCATETEAYIEKGKALSCKSDDESQPCECLDNRGKSETESLALCECPRGGPCDGMKIKKKCSVFLCCIESTSPPAKIDRKRRRKKKKRKSRNKGSQLIKMD